MGRGPTTNRIRRRWAGVRLDSTPQLNRRREKRVAGTPAETLAPPPGSCRSWIVRLLESPTHPNAGRRTCTAPRESCCAASRTTSSIQARPTSCRWLRWRIRGESRATGALVNDAPVGGSSPVASLLPRQRRSGGMERRRRFDRLFVTRGSFPGTAGDHVSGWASRSGHRVFWSSGRIACLRGLPLAERCPNVIRYWPSKTFLGR